MWFGLRKSEIPRCRIAAPRWRDVVRNGSSGSYRDKDTKKLDRIYPACHIRKVRTAANPSRKIDESGRLDQFEAESNTSTVNDGMKILAIIREIPLHAGTHLARKLGNSEIFAIFVPIGNLRQRLPDTYHTLNIENMAFFKEFKEFALKGNVMDMAVGVIIGGAFGKIVSSLVNDILMPPIGALIGNTDFSQLRLDISKVRDVTSDAMQSVGKLVGDGAAAAQSAPVEPVYWNYGAFIQQCIDFAILAFCVFLMVKLMNRLMKKKAQTPPAPPAPSKEELLLTEIRDLLKAQQQKQD